MSKLTMAMPISKVTDTVQGRMDTWDILVTEYLPRNLCVSPVIDAHHLERLHVHIRGDGVSEQCGLGINQCGVTGIFRALIVERVMIGVEHGVFREDVGFGPVGYARRHR